MLKIINKVSIRIKKAWLSFAKAKKRADLKGLFKNPLFFLHKKKSALKSQQRKISLKIKKLKKQKLEEAAGLLGLQKKQFQPPAKRGSLYFGLISVFLFLSIYLACDNSINANGLGKSSHTFFNPFFNEYENLSVAGLFSSQANAISLETPDLKIMQNNTLCGVSTPCVVTGKVLGDVFGSNQNQKNVVDYTVQPGDTFSSIAESYKISVNTLLWANELTNSSSIKVGQSLAVLPTDGVLHIVKSGDTISAIASRYGAKADDIISYNDLASQDDIYIGDILIIPGGTMPKNSSSVINKQAPLADNFFINPTAGTITQGLHYMNAVDIANSCGTPVRAAASGIVKRAVYNNGWNSGMGNYITIFHPTNGTVTYYGHLKSVLVKPGDTVDVGQSIGFIGNTGNVVGTTGCHLHFQVTGAKNPLSRYFVGTKIRY